MSYTISVQTTGSSMILQIKADAESGVYTGIRTVRTSYGSTFDEPAKAAQSHRAFVEHVSTVGFDVDLIHLRKLVAISDGDTKYATYAFYFELHVSKKKAVDSSWTYTLATGWFPLNTYYLAVTKSTNFSMFTWTNANTSIQLYEVDPVSKARQIYDSV